MRRVRRVDKLASSCASVYIFWEPQTPGALWVCPDLFPGALISPQPDQEVKNIGIISRTPAISTTSRRELSSSFFLQRKAQKEIHAILTKTLACFLLGRTNDLSATLICYYLISGGYYLMRVGRH